MPMSQRVALATALSLAGVAGRVAPSARPQGGEVRKANSPTPAKVAAPATLGTLDLEAALEGYDKYKVIGARFQADAKKEQGKQTILVGEFKQAQEEMARFKPGSVEFQKYNDK